MFINLIIVVSVVSLVFLQVEGNRMSGVIGPSGSGKSTLVNGICGAHFETGNGQHRVTSTSEVVPCGEIDIAHTVGLFDISPSESTDTAYYRGLKGLLQFLNGIEVGRLYFVILSSAVKDHMRLVEQVTYLKQVLDPRIPWTVVVNCQFGICPSEEAGGYSALIRDIVKATEADVLTLDVRKLTIQDIQLFVPDTPDVKIVLPAGWEEILEKNENIDSLRDQMTQQAVLQCKDFILSKKQTETAVANYVCPLEKCSAFNCDSIPACPDIACPPYPCPDRSTCDWHSREEYDCHCFLGICGTCHRDHHGTDQKCIDKVNNCLEKASTACREHQKSVQACNADRTQKCESGRKISQDCESKRGRDCIQLREKFVSSNEETLNSLNGKIGVCLKAFPDLKV